MFEKLKSLFGKKKAQVSPEPAVEKPEKSELVEPTPAKETLPALEPVVSAPVPSPVEPGTSVAAPEPRTVAEVGKTEIAEAKEVPEDKKAPEIEEVSETSVVSEASPTPEKVKFPEPQVKPAPVPPAPVETKAAKATAEAVPAPAAVPAPPVIQHDDEPLPSADEEAEPLDEEYRTAEKKESWLSHMKKRLLKTRHSLKMKLEDLLGRHKGIDDDFLEELEEILISSDLGVKSTAKILEHFEEIARMEKIQDADQLMELIREVLLVILGDEPSPIKYEKGKMNIILMIGVNGVGKTTTIGKLASRFAAGHLRVVLAAGDTFRAGAIEQLDIWGRRSGCDVIKTELGADAGAVVYDAIKAARARKADVLIVDTAGRLHNKFNLMEELKKVRRVISKEAADSPLEVLLVLDANTGQNGIAQAKVFQKEIDVTGIALTKIDGTAKGGVTVAIKEELKLPVKLIGIGEKINDLRVFNPKEFVRALMEE